MFEIPLFGGAAGVFDAFVVVVGFFRIGM